MFSRLFRAIRAFVSGLEYGYPICCVANYSLDTFLGIPSGLSRGEEYAPSVGTYVPCRFHKRVLKALTQVECAQLLRTGFAVEHLGPNDSLETRVNGQVVSRMRVPNGFDAVFLSQIDLREA
jgi:hypothetical protein